MKLKPIFTTDDNGAVIMDLVDIKTGEILEGVVEHSFSEGVEMPTKAYIEVYLFDDDGKKYARLSR